MANNVEKIVKTYQKLSQIPALLTAKLSKNSNLITTIWSQRNLERGKTMKFQKTIYIDENLKKINETIPLDVSSELLVAVSPSEKYCAVLRDFDNKQFLEIWQNNKLFRSVDLKTLDLHGSVYTDSQFTTFQWSIDEKKLLYLAEEKPAKTEPFYKRKGKKTEDNIEEITKGEEYVYKQDWGEQLVGKIKSILIEYNIETDNIEILPGIPKNICPAQAIYSIDGKYIVGVGLKTEPRKLGLIYCTNRPSTIFWLDFKGKYGEFKNFKNKSLTCPVFTPDGQQLVWLERQTAGPHASCLTVKKCNLPLKEESESEIVVDQVLVNITLNSGTTFYGFYNPNIVNRCFASYNRLIISTNQQNTINTYVIDLNTKQVTELLYNDGSQIVLDVYNDLILINRRNFLKSDRLVIGKLPKKGYENDIKWIELNESEEISEFNNVIYDYLDLEQHKDQNDTCKSFSAIYLGPKSANEKSVNLLVWPHGGPHSAFANNLFLESSLFLSMNYAVLLVNYRGSVGNGEESIKFLLGKIGKSDVSDCILATETALKKYPWLNPNGLGLVGGSHGGFLVTHLSGQYPDMFKAVVARNPVIDIASLSIISDIPDWSFAECNFEYKQAGPLDDDKLVAMRRASPIVHAHKVKAPTLLQIGSKDLRVPCHQGLEYYHRLKANGIVVKMNLYEDNHPLGQIPHELDNIINTILWFEKYLK